MGESDAYPYTERDDELHPLSDDVWETETNWWSFNVPERKLGGWVHGSIRRNKKDCTTRFFVWNDDAPQRDRTLYTYLAERPLPEKVDLRDFSFPDGHHLKVLKPLMDYHVSFRSPDGEALIEFVHRGLHKPHPFTRGEPPFRDSGHFDQTGHVTGELVLRGERIPIDCHSVRDRSWGPRPVHEEIHKSASGSAPPRKHAPTPSGDWRAIERQRGRGRIQYIFGTNAAKTAFVAFMRPQDAGTSDWWPINHGYLLRNGTCAGLVKGESRVRTFRDPVSGYSDHILVEAVDTTGRELRAEGHAMSRAPSKTGGANALFRWFFDGEIGWGEDQDGWRSDHWQDLLRALHATR